MTCFGLTRDRVRLICPDKFRCSVRPGSALSYRSLLFVPGARPDRFAKALAAGADAVCIDLEDAVPPAAKPEARAATLAFLAVARPAGGPALGVRFNRAASLDGVKDIVAYAESGAAADFVMAPKCESAAEIAIVAGAIARTVRFWPIIESAAGVEAAQAIAAAPGVAGVLFGGADFSVDIGASMEAHALAYARGRLVVACRGAGAALLDVPHLDVRDHEGLSRSTMMVKAMGFTGRACIHPDQVAAVNAVFTPGEAEISEARRVIAALEDAQGAAALLDGKLIERPVILAARQVLERAGVV